MKQKLKEFFQRKNSVVATELKECRRAFIEALEFLQKTPLQKDDKMIKLVRLPWFLVLGTPNTGKSTLIRKSELDFIYTQKFVSSQPQTQHVDWWLTRDAIFLDVAGKYFAPAPTTEDEHDQRFTSLLSLFKRYHRKQPVRGLILTTSLSELLQPEEIKHQEAAVRDQRLTKLCHSLKYPEQIPLQVLITQSDLISGFNEYFANLNNEERKSLLGVTFPIEVCETEDTYLQHFATEWNALIKRLHQHALERLRSVTDLEQRALIQHFPLQLETLKSTIQALIYDCVTAKRTSGYYLSGIYFLSSLQQGQPLDAFATLFQDNYNTVSLASTMPAFEGQPYFIDRALLQSTHLPTIPPTMSAAYEWMRKCTYYSFFAACGFFVLFCSYTLIQELKDEINRINSAEKALTEYNLLVTQLGDTNEAPLEQLILPLNSLANAEKLLTANGDYDWLTWFGLSSPTKLEHKTNKAYQHALQTLLLPQLREVVAEQLSSGQITFPSQLYSTLKTYLMLGNPELLDKPWIMHWVEEYWHQSNPQTPELLPQILGHVEAALESQQSKVSLNSQLVSQTRAKLYALPTPQLTYALLLAKATGHQQPGILLINDPKNNFFQGVENEIPYFFTKAGYETVFAKELPQATQSALTGDWVLGRPPVQHLKQAWTMPSLVQQTRVLYLSDYAEIWQKSLNELQLAHLSNLSQLIDLLTYLTSKESPIGELMKTVQYNTGFLTQEAMANPYLAAQIAPALQQFQGLSDLLRTNMVPVDPNFKAMAKSESPWQRLVQQFAQLKLTLFAVAHSQNPGQAAFDLSIDRINHPNELDVFNQLTMTANQLPPPVNLWCQQAGNQGFELLLATTQNYINSVWVNAVLPTYTAQLHNRYPLVHGAPLDASVSDFSLFFAPHGILDQFFSTYLSPFVDQETDPWTLKQRSGISLPLSPEMLAALQQVYRISHEFFPTESNEFSVPFKLIPVAFTPDIKQFNLQLDDKLYTDVNAQPKPIVINWGPQQPLSNIRYDIISSTDNPVNATYKGPWALLKMLENNYLEEDAQANHYQLTLTINGHTATYEIIPERPEHPFAFAAQPDLTLPQSLWTEAATG
jgi:type VI secretion system protein ImpL